MNDRDENKRALDTALMQKKLKGESFPEDWKEFLDDSIRGFFDSLLNETGQKKARSSERQTSPAPTATSSWKEEDGASGITISCWLSPCPLT